LDPGIISSILSLRSAAMSSVTVLNPVVCKVAITAWSSARVTGAVIGVWVTEGAVASVLPVDITLSVGIEGETDDVLVALLVRIVLCVGVEVRAAVGIEDSVDEPFFAFVEILIA
jgi:hypothetical protein